MLIVKTDPNATIIDIRRFFLSQRSTDFSFKLKNLKASPYSTSKAFTASLNVGVCLNFITNGRRW